MNHIELRFSALLQNEPFARTSIASFVSPLNPTIEEIVEIKTLVSEAVSNAIIHGYRLDHERDVYVKANIKGNRVEIIVQDYGVGIKNLEEAMKPHVSELKDDERCGMGITIMQSLSDSFEIKSTLGLGTKVIIVKNLKNCVDCN